MDVAFSNSILEFPQAGRQSTGDTMRTTENHSPDARSRLGQGLIFSRKFIVSYNIVLLAVLLYFTLWYWGRKSSVARKSVRSGLPHDDADLCGENHTIVNAETTQQGSGPSSSSSSSSGTLTPLGRAKERVDETTSLLRHHTPPQTFRPSVHIIRSWMMYQPRNVPIINKSLPSNATSIAVLLFVGLNIFYLFYRVPLSVPTAFILGDRAGLVFVANLPLLYILAAKNQPIKWLTGHSYESLNIIHRRLGELMCLLAVVHFTAMLIVYYTLLSARVSFRSFLAIPLVWLGIGAFTAYELLYLTSLGSFRQRFYELFLGLHVVLQVAALGFLFFHHSGSRPYVGIALGIFLIDRLVFRIGLRTRTLEADLSILEDGETVLLSANWPVSNTPWWRKAHIKHGWEPTEHVFLSVPALSKKHIVQAHPFTIASAAPNLPKDDATHAWLNFIIRARDGFSRDLLQYAQSHRSADVRIDGPYGSLHALEMLRDSDHAVVVAGGSGIAVAYPILWDLLVDESSAQSPSGATDKRRVTLIWVVHDSTHIDWIGQERLDELREHGLHVVVPAPTRKAGRPDIDGLLESAITQDCHIGNPLVGVVVSGPDSMNRSVRNTCASMVRSGRDVRVSVEKFGW